MSLVRRRNYNRRAGNYGALMGVARYMYNNRQGFQNMISARRARSFSGTRTGTQNRVTSGIGVTSQYDRKLVYRKRTMPRFKKRRWRKFKQRVLAVSEKTLGTSTIVRNNLITNTFNMTPANSTNQNYVQLALYSVYSAGSDDLNDIKIISGDTRLKNSSKIIFQSGILDITMRLQSQLAQSPATGNSSLSAEIDVYELSMNSTTGQSGEATDLVSAFTNGHTDTSNIPGLTTALQATSRGWTPFDCPEALSQYKIKIWKKTKYFLSAEQTATYQIRDPKRHIFSKDSIPTAQSVNWQGVTRWVFIVFKPVPGYNYVASPNNDNLILNVGVTRKYMYKINEDSTDYDAYGS